MIIDLALIFGYYIALVLTASVFAYLTDSESKTKIKKMLSFGKRHTIYKSLKTNPITVDLGSELGQYQITFLVDKNEHEILCLYKDRWSTVKLCAGLWTLYTMLDKKGKEIVSFNRIQ